MKIRPLLQSKVLRQIHQQKCLRLKPAKFKFGSLLSAGLQALATMVEALKRGGDK